MALPSPLTDLVGRQLAGRYRINRPIASGGMAQVFEATDETLARRVAVKILHPHLADDELFVRRFRAEAVAAARLAHPSIVSVYDTVVDGGLNAIVMELVSGTTLRADIDTHGPLQLSAVLAIGSQVADALAAAHATGLVHRDVKPANILLSADGRVLVADFGIAKAAQGGDHTDDGAMVGTAKYLAPEQVEGRPVDGRTDVYALGVVLYEALTGVPPFAGESDTATALLRLHADPTRPTQLRPDIPPAVEAVIGRALARRPDDRFPSASAMRAALLAAGADPGRAPQVAQQAVASALPSANLHPPAPPPPVPGQPYQPAAVDEDPPRSRVGAVLVVLALVAGAVAAASWVGITGTPAASSAATIVGFTTLDPPPGADGENDQDLPHLLDGDPATSWSTESYRNPDLTARKPGVGLVATLEAPAVVTAVEVESPSPGWRAEIRVVDGPVPDTIDGWGPALGSVDSAAQGTTRIAIDETTATSVMIWFTHVGDDHAVQIDAVTVFRR